MVISLRHGAFGGLRLTQDLINTHGESFKPTFVGDFVKWKKPSPFAPLALLIYPWPSSTPLATFQWGPSSSSGTDEICIIHTFPPPPKQIWKQSETGWVPAGVSNFLLLPTLLSFFFEIIIFLIYSFHHRSQQGSLPL